MKKLVFLALSALIWAVPAAADEESDRAEYIRANYSNPPAHGGSIVTTILGDAELRKLWETELSEMCARIADMRKAFVAGLAKAGAKEFERLADAFLIGDRQVSGLSFCGFTFRSNFRDKGAISCIASDRGAFGRA